MMKNKQKMKSAVRVDWTRSLQIFNVDTLPTKLTHKSYPTVQFCIPRAHKTHCRSVCIFHLLLTLKWDLKVRWFGYLGLTQATRVQTRITEFDEGWGVVSIVN